MEHLTNTSPATNAGHHKHLKHLDTMFGDMDDQVAVCANGDVLPMTREQARNNFLERGTPLKTQLGRDDIAFVCSQGMADKWPSRAAIVAYVAALRSNN